MSPDLDRDLNRWMSFIDDSVSLAELTIPGTHDAGALHEPVPGTTTCQHLSIPEQLKIGVRYLDLRLRHCNDALLVHHGPVYQHENFDGVLTGVTEFLRTHPSETVIMEVSSEYKPENNTETFEQAIMRRIDHDAYGRFWWRETHIPTLGETRGKIVLLRRFPGSPAVSGGIDVIGWRDDTQFTLTDTRGAAIVVQDRYRVAANDEKWDAVLGMLDRASSDASGVWHLNFTSGFRSVLGVPNITSVSNDINNRLLDYLSAHARRGVRFGTVISDFVDKRIVQQELRAYFS